MQILERESMKNHVFPFFERGGIMDIIMNVNGQLIKPAKNYEIYSDMKNYVRMGRVNENRAVFPRDWRRSLQDVAYRGCLSHSVGSHRSSYFRD